MADEIQSEVKVTRQINIPGWTFDALKILATIIITLALGYVRFAQVENKVMDHTSTLTELKAKTESSRDAITLTSQKVGTLELQQTLVSGEFRDSLKRIEEDVKELKMDLKTSRTKP